MVLCVGQATRLNEYLTADDKRYRATLRFGTETDTQDSSGNVVATCALPTMDEAGFRDVLTRFVGKQEQTPPLYSAIKKDGKPLYRYAREGWQWTTSPSARSRSTPWSAFPTTTRKQ